ncbi:MAG: hypothetical protein ACJ75Z_11705 [Solirubrobacterales bacterium]
MKVGTISMIVAALALAGCGGSGGDVTTATPVAPSPTTTAGTKSPTGKLPPGAVGPTDTAEEATEGPGATEASPEAPAEGPSAGGDLSSGDQAAVTAVVSEYIAALDRHRAARVCALLEPSALDLSDLPRQRGDCRRSLAASIGVRPRSGGPAWRRTALVEVKVEDLGDDRARVTATVTHHFSDRKYVSVEDDVVYLERVDGRWLLAKPSGTLYRAVGYPEPPLRALAPPAAW